MTNPNDRTQPRPPLACPVCSVPLTQKIRVGVPIDVCDEHGIWLDRGELEEIIQRDWVGFQSQYVAADDERLDEERRRGRMEGTLWELFLG